MTAEREGESEKGERDSSETAVHVLRRKNRTIFKMKNHDIFGS
jgi:hypothetical protein